MIRYLFIKFRQIFNLYSKKSIYKRDLLVKKILTKYEYLLYSNCSNYDKWHMYYVYINFIKNKDKRFIKYYKLDRFILLHDIGKGNIETIKKIFNKIIEIKEIKKHNIIGSKMIRDKRIKYLIISHHRADNKFMNRVIKEFKKFDDVN